MKIQFSRVLPRQGRQMKYHKEENCAERELALNGTHDKTRSKR